MKKFNIKFTFIVSFTLVYLFTFSNTNNPESIVSTNSIHNQNISIQEIQESIILFSSEKKKMIVNVSDSNSTNTATAIVIIYSLDGMDELGPFDLYEGTPLNVDIDSHEWSVQIVDQTPESDVTWRIE